MDTYAQSYLKIVARMRKFQHIFFIMTLTIIALTACNLAPAMVDNPTNTPPISAPNVRLGQIQTSPVPTQERPVRDVPTLAPTDDVQTHQIAHNDADAVACDPDAPDQRPRHTVVANLDYSARTVDVSQSIRYTNRADTPLAELIFSVEANSTNGAFILDTLLINNRPVDDYALQRNRLTVPLMSPLMPGCDVQISLRFQLKPPRIASGISAFRGYFGYSVRQMNLAFWLPTVAPYHGKWLINPPSTIGENAVFEQVDWDVLINLINAPNNLTIAAPGYVEQRAPHQWHYRFEGARDFSMSLSESYNISRATTPSGVTIEVYTFPDALIQTDSGTIDAPAHVLSEASRSFIQYEALFGAYPYERFLVIQGDFPDGMEFSGLVFVSSAWFYGFTGGYANYLTLITVHEVAHQWWYARVGNNAALAPWLDEALATYSEYIYYEEYHPELKNWWWSFRVAGYSPRGNVDSTVYEFETIRDYINAVYLRGVQMLHNLRETIGTEAFFDLLKRYAATADGEIATPELFWSLLSSQQYADTQNLRGEFFQNPDILPTPEDNQTDNNHDD